MIEFHDSVFIPTARTTVFRFASRPENMPLWNPAVAESKVLGNLKTGARVVQVIRLVGHTFDAVHEVTAYEPCRRIAYRSVSGPVDVGGAMEFCSRRGGTLVDWLVCCGGYRLALVAGNMVAALGHHEMDVSLDRLRRILSETSAAIAVKSG